MILTHFQIELSGNAVIRGKADNSEIVITSTTRLAGAIHSLTWNGKEFIDSADHGRQLQSASNFDCGKRFIPEVFNPTEAGSRRDGSGPKSTSKLLKIKVNKSELETWTQMAFWLAPGERSEGHLAYNDTLLSKHILHKRVKIGYKDLPGVIQYDVTFSVPKEEEHAFGQFEAVTGYMPPEFSSFYTFDPWKKKLASLDDGPGEQGLPVIFATKNGRHAMGIFSPPLGGYSGPGYGRFRFKAERVNKWNCVFRRQNVQGIGAGPFRFQCFIAVGTLEDVQEMLQRLQILFGGN